AARPEAGWHRHLRGSSDERNEERVPMSTIRTLICDLKPESRRTVTIRGWVYRRRVLAKTTFIIVRDCTGDAQCVAATASLTNVHLKLDDAIEVSGVLREDA